MTRRPKTVFILGAGFSYDAGIPMQGELFSTILGYTLPNDLIRCRDNLLDFIKNIFGLSQGNVQNLPLEDIYTPLHNSISRNEYLKRYSPDELKTVENDLNRLISHVIDNGKRDFDYNYGYVEEFISKLLERKEAAKTVDSFSLISLNWDILLDKRLFEAVKGKGVIDYCCHCVGVEGRPIIPSLVAREQGLFAIKLLKMHGSLNWVTCPKCQRLFVNKNKKEAIEAFEKRVGCRFCKKGIKLNPALLLPSFQKDLAKFHFEHIWNQAGIELSEATKIVFMGYSFPLADFDFRGLITKHVGKAEVEVVLKSSDGEPTNEGTRYEDYFGNKCKAIHYDGVADYIKNNLENVL